MLNLESKIEAILFFKNEPVSIAELAMLLKEKSEAIREGLLNLGHSYKNRGLIVVSDGESFSLGTHPEAGPIIENLQKEELSRDLSRASLETLAIILYRGPIARREVDHIRGVNSSFILRTLLVRGLVERAGDISGERSYSYKTTIKLLEYLGVGRQEDLPEYHQAFDKIEEFIKTTPTTQDEQF